MSYFKRCLESRWTKACHTPNLNHQRRSPLRCPGKPQAEITALPRHVPVECSAKGAGWHCASKVGDWRPPARLPSPLLHPQSNYASKESEKTLSPIFLFIRREGCWKFSVCSLKALVFLKKQPGFFPQLWGLRLNIFHTYFSPANGAVTPAAKPPLASCQSCQGQQKFSAWNRSYAWERGKQLKPATVLFKWGGTNEKQIVFVPSSSINPVSQTKGVPLLGPLPKRHGVPCFLLSAWMEVNFFKKFSLPGKEML